MRIVFMGTPEFSLNILQALIDSEHDVVGVVTQPDRVVGRKKQLSKPPVKELAENYQIPVFQPEKIREDYEKILAWQPDIIITCAYGQIIPKILLDTPPYHAINVHASLLPQYRGGAPIHRAIVEGNKKTGITIMYMDVKMDEGDIINQKEIEIKDTDNVGILHDKLSVLGAKLLMKTLPLIFDNSSPRKKQNHELATYAYNIKPEDEVINWNESSLEVYNKIRGLNPWPGAYTKLLGKRVKIYEAVIVNKKFNGKPGEIVEIDKEGIYISTIDNKCLQLVEIQLEGKKRQLVKDVLNGNHPFNVGQQFA